MELAFLITYRACFREPALHGTIPVMPTLKHYISLAKSEETRFINGGRIIETVIYRSGATTAFVYTITTDGLPISVSWPTELGENGAWAWYNTSLDVKDLYPRLTFYYPLKSKQELFMPQSVKIELGADKTEFIIEPKPAYTGPLVVGEKYPIIGRPKPDVPFDNKFIEILEINEDVFRVILDEQQFVMPEAMVRDIIEEFPEPKISSDLTF